MVYSVDKCLSLGLVDWKSQARIPNSRSSGDKDGRSEVSRHHCNGSGGDYWWALLEAAARPTKLYPVLFNKAHKIPYYSVTEFSKIVKI